MEPLSQGLSRKSILFPPQISPYLATTWHILPSTPGILWQVWRFSKHSITPFKLLKMSRWTVQWAIQFNYHLPTDVRHHQRPRWFIPHVINVMDGMRHTFVQLKKTVDFGDWKVDQWVFYAPDTNSPTHLIYSDFGRVKENRLWHLDTLQGHKEQELGQQKGKTAFCFVFYTF